MAEVMSRASVSGDQDVDAIDQHLDDLADVDYLIQPAKSMINNDNDVESNGDDDDDNDDKEDDVYHNDEDASSAGSITSSEGMPEENAISQEATASPGGYPTSDDEQQQQQEEEEEEGIIATKPNNRSDNPESKPAEPALRNSIVMPAIDVNNDVNPTATPSSENKPETPTLRASTATALVDSPTTPNTPSNPNSTELAVPAPEIDFFSKAMKSVVGMARANAYDMCISHITQEWYKAMIEELEPGSIVLDVGIGTATALVHNRTLLNLKNIRVIGIDNDEDYIEACNIHIRKASIGNRIRVYHQDVYKMDQLRGRVVLPNGLGLVNDPEDVQFDAILFSGTLPVLEDKVGVLNGLTSWRKPNCKIMICQAAQYESPITPFARMFKPVLFYLTSVDHGELITEAEAIDLFETTIRRECKLDVTYHEKMDGHNIPMEAAYLTILEPMSARDAKINDIAARIG